MLIFSIDTFADGINLHIARGLGFPYFNKTDNIYLNSFVENSYKVSNSESSADFTLNIGGGYLWTHFKYPMAVSLNVSGLYMTYTVPGTVFPFINAGQFETLNFSANDSTYAILFEPKIIFTQYKYQPYFLIGIGRSWNRLSKYSESASSPVSSSAPIPAPFGSKTVVNPAYELGFGIQTVLYQTAHLAYFNIFLDYRYMNMGTMKLAASPSQTTPSGPNLGLLQAQSISVGIEYQVT